MEVGKLRISKFRTYLFGIIDEIINSTEYQINANMLSNDINNYSLDKIPTNTEEEKWIIGLVKRKDVYSLRSRMAYSQDTINNLMNVGFFEIFEQKIKSNNDKGVLPEIDGVERVECLNCGTLNNAETNTAEFDIQLQVTYRENIKEEVISI